MSTKVATTEDHKSRFLDGARWSLREVTILLALGEYILTFISCMCAVSSERRDVLPVTVLALYFRSKV